jgi:hypothetical protein
MVNKCLKKKYSTSLGIREILIKNDMEIPSPSSQNGNHQENKQQQMLARRQGNTLLV